MSIEYKVLSIGISIPNHIVAFIYYLLNSQYLIPCTKLKWH